MAERKPKPALAPEVIDRFRGRFDAIGPWQLSVDDSGVTVEWEQSPALAALGCRAGVEFEIEAGAGGRDPDERMMALWDGFQRGWDRHAAVLRRAMVAVYREGQPHLFAAEQERFPADLPEDAVMGLVRAAVRLHRFGADGEAFYDLEASFAAAWDGEHVWAFEYDEAAEAADEFGESSKG